MRLLTWLASCISDQPKALVLDEKAISRRTPQHILRFMLSANSGYTLSDSLLATEDERIELDSTLNHYRQIDRGQCGTIRAIDGYTVAKYPNEDKFQELRNDVERHQAVRNAFSYTSKRYSACVNVTEFNAWVSPSPSSRDLIQIVTQSQLEGHRLVTERILPVPLTVRRALVDIFAPWTIKQTKEAFLIKPENTDCLIRLYLGRRAPRSMESELFGLRNFVLTANDMEMLGLDTRVYAKAMAQALAIIHWRAHLDADDVEFVLGRTREVTSASRTSSGAQQTSSSSVQTGTTGSRCESGIVGIWLLDFNRCQEFTADVDGVKQLVGAFFHNDPYYPRPGAIQDKDKALWKYFRQVYLETSRQFVSQASTMPEQFNAAVEAEAESRPRGGPLFW